MNVTEKEKMLVNFSFNFLHLSVFFLFMMCCLLASTSHAQEMKGKNKQDPDLFSSGEEAPAAESTKVDVEPLARDEEIAKRINKILIATGWFAEPKVRVSEGVAFLTGKTETNELKLWAGDLARRTQDVVAVVNQIHVLESSIWDLRPAWNGLLVLWRDVVYSLPFLFFALLIIGLSIGAGILTTKAMRFFLFNRVRANILRNVLAGSAGVFVILAGIYIVLRVSGLTQLAMTVVGGTGLIGLALGIAFRNITENVLASIFLSIQKPFDNGDLVEISGETGYVQQLNMRTTVIMTPAGNLVQIPNASVYQGKVCNYTTNANRREDFIIGIGYDDSIDEAQEAARKVLVDHPAVLDNPEPSILADSLGKATVNLRVYFWINGRKHSWLKVRSSVMRLVKIAFQKQGISMPDESREVIFPKGVPVTMVEAKQESANNQKPLRPDSRRDVAVTAPSTKAEGGLSSEAEIIEDQAKHGKPLNMGENLLVNTEMTAESSKLEKEQKPPPKGRIK